MKQKTLLVFVMSLFITSAFAQQKKQNTTTGYAITAAEKGGRSWKEVKLVNISTGEELKNIYNSKEESQPLNARTKKPVVKKETEEIKEVIVQRQAVKKTVNLDNELNAAQPREERATVVTPDGQTRTHLYHYNSGNQVRLAFAYPREQSNKPFATNSAAMAYDKKHERLYYTPMGINQLRYIDLKTGKIYYFEDEPFGTVAHSGDASNQITRMVIASDGNGYALTNDGNHLLRFTTGKKPTITDLGALTDDASNANFSVHSRSGYGGDMIADKNENLYLITANRNVFKINIATKVAKYTGAIQGLPRGFSTNGAMVEEGSKVIVASSENTSGYYRFDLNTLKAEKVSESGSVFNASDLANGNLAFDKKKKKEEAEEAPAPVKEQETVVEEKTAKGEIGEEISDRAISVFPNPVTNNRVKISFDNIPAGAYQLQVLDMSGKLVSNQQVNVQTKGQINEIRLPRSLTSGTYLIKVSNEAKGISNSVKILVQ